MAKTARLVQHTTVPEVKNSSDTIRLWEAYRDQALLWRALALLQIPGTLIAIIFAWVLWANTEITLDVPAKPLPGQYPAEELHDSEFVEVATNFVNLIASYQPQVARRQFQRSREFLIEPYLSQFNAEMMEKELKTIETTSRTQFFFVDPTKIEVHRSEGQVVVTFIGERQKYVAGKEVDPVVTKYDITLVTIPRNDINPYGIVISNAYMENVKQ